MTARETQRDMRPSSLFLTALLISSFSDDQQLVFLKKHHFHTTEHFRQTPGTQTPHPLPLLLVPLPAVETFSHQGESVLVILPLSVGENFEKGSNMFPLTAFPGSPSNSPLCGLPTLSDSQNVLTGHLLRSRYCFELCLHQSTATQSTKKYKQQKWCAG